VRLRGRRIAVVALGDLLEGDDGAGSAALAELVARFELLPEVEAMDLGTAGPDLADFLRSFFVVLMLDAVRQPDTEPGSSVIERDLQRIRSPARGAGELLGLDPLYVANEGKLAAVARRARPPATPWRLCGRIRSGRGRRSSAKSPRRARVGSCCAARSAASAPSTV